MYKLQIITPASEMAINLADIKQFLHITHDGDDVLLTNHINIATTIIERYINRAITAKQYRLTYNNYAPHNIALPFAPAFSASVTLVGKDSTQSTFNSDGYRLSADGESIDFYAQPASHTIYIDYDAGYEFTQDIPADITQAITNISSNLYHNNCADISVATKQLLAPYRKVRL